MKAVILAGGLGERLRPFTELIPKSLLPLGEKSLLDIQIELLKRAGVEEIYLAVNYKAENIMSYLGDGHKHGVKIHYSRETIPLGTCGPIKLLENQLKKPFLLINGDILTKANLKEFYDLALSYVDSPLTVATKLITSPFRFGKIDSVGCYIKNIEEKPNFTHEILAGLYVIKPEVFNFVPSQEYFGIDTLIKLFIQLNIPITKYIIQDYWLDIGVIEDYKHAEEDYERFFQFKNAYEKTGSI